MPQSRLRLAQTIADSTLANGATQELSKHVAAYLLTEGRVDELDSLLRDVQEEWARRGFIEVLTYCAHPLPDAVKRDIVDEAKRVYPEATTIHITELHDPNVVGGVRLKLPNQQLDLSVEAKLDLFKQLTSGKD